MDKMISYEGDSYEELEQCLKGYVKKEKIADLLNLLENEKVLEPDTEKFSYAAKESKISGYGKLIPKTHYFLNVKESTIILAAAALSAQYMDSKVDIVMMLLALKNIFTKLSEENGEYCIVKEGVSKKKGFTEEIFNKNRGECINNYLKCQYNDNGNCLLTATNIVKVLEQLQDRNICIKKNGFYKICF